MFMVARNKRSPRSDVLNSLQHNYNQDSLGLGIDKRGNHHMKVNFTDCASNRRLIDVHKLCRNDWGQIQRNSDIAERQLDSMAAINSNTTQIGIGR